MATLTSRQASILTVRIDYATHGRDSGDATRAYISGGISKKVYNEAASIGIQQYRARVMEIEKVISNKKIAQQVANLGLSIIQNEQIIKLLVEVQEQQILLCVHELDQNGSEREFIINSMGRVIYLDHAQRNT